MGMLDEETDMGGDNISSFRHKLNKRMLERTDERASEHRVSPNFQQWNTAKNPQE
jgi:hypothetical protein